MSDADAGQKCAPVLVLGLGNRMLHDAAAGLELLAGVRARWGDDPRIDFVDGGSQDIALTPHLAGRRALLVLDVVARGAPPGTVHVCRNVCASDQIRGEGGQERHACDMLAAAELVGEAPSRVVVVGVEPEVVCTGAGLSPVVAEALAEAVDEAVVVLGDFVSLLPIEVPACTK